MINLIKNNKKTLKTPSRISEDFGQFSKIMATGMRETFEKKVQKITFAQNFLEWFKRKTFLSENSHQK